MNFRKGSNWQTSIQRYPGACLLVAGGVGWVPDSQQGTTKDGGKESLGVTFGCFGTLSNASTRWGPRASILQMEGDRLWQRES